MTLLENKLRKLTAIKDSLPDIAIKVIQEAAPQIEDKNIAQLQKGQRSDGSSLPNYSPTSVAKFGKPFGPIKLYDTGDFYRGIKLEVGPDKLTMDDTDWKTPKLTERFGDNILGLSDQSISELKDEVLLPGIRYEVERLLSA